MSSERPYSFHGSPWPTEDAKDRESTLNWPKKVSKYKNVQNRSKHRKHLHHVVLPRSTSAGQEISPNWYHDTSIIHIIHTASCCIIINLHSITFNYIQLHSITFNYIQLYILIHLTSFYC